MQEHLHSTCTSGFPFYALGSPWVPHSLAVGCREPKGDKPAVSEAGEVFMTVAQLIKQEERRRAGEAH